MSQALKKLAELEETLRPLSHGVEALIEIQSFSKSLRKTAEKVDVFNSYGGLVTRPIEYPEALEQGAISDKEDRFWLLQGDIVTTKNAFNFGERVTAPQKYVVVNSTCDLVPNRKKKSALLFEVQSVKRPVTEKERAELSNKLASLLNFQDRQNMYLPPFGDDPDDVVFNIINFDDPATIRLDALVLADRVASMSLVGWRIFSSILRVNLTREATTEANMRQILAPYLLSVKESSEESPLSVKESPEESLFTGDSGEHKA